MNSPNPNAAVSTTTTGTTKKITFWMQNEGPDIKHYVVSKTEDSFFTSADSFLAAISAILASLRMGWQLYLCIGLFWVIRLVYRASQVKEGLLLGKILMLKESLSVIRELGIQLTAVYWNGKKSIIWIERSKIKNVFIHEGITRFHVVYYLAFIIDNKEKTIVAFPVSSIFVILHFQNLLPRIHILQQVYLGVRSTIYPGEE
jgi:hypothetical protein